MPKLTEVTKKWGNKPVFDKLSLDIATGKTTVVLGRSGIGKTTLLSIIAGVTDYMGTCEGFGRISYVFQEPRLIPFLTVEENLVYALGAAVDKAELNDIIDRYLNLTGMTALKKRVVDKLSGGEKQRVSLIRGFAYPSETLLCDEPFTSLDISLKMKIIDLFKGLFSYSPKTCVLVTHSVDEALYLADEIIFLYDGGYKKFIVDTDKSERAFGYEASSDLRKRLYNLFD